jgi:hypothetical protein
MEGCPYKPRKISTEKKVINKKIGSFYNPTKTTFRKDDCPEGYHRKAYDKKNINIKQVCIKNKGHPEKIIEKFKLPPLGKKDDLKPYGYKTNKNSVKRLESLLDAAKVLTYKTVVLRLSLLRTLTRRSQVKYSKIYDEDIKNLQKWRLENPDLYKKKIIKSK